MQWRSFLRSWLPISVLVAACGTTAVAEDLRGQVTIDHVRILVRDIHTSRELLRDGLAFNFPDAEPYNYPEGSAHDGTDLADDSYLELIGITNSESLMKVRPWIVEFLQRRQGLHSVGFLVSSAEAFADRLKSQGIDAPLFRLMRGSPTDKPVLLVTPKLRYLPEGAIFFLEYPPRTTPRVRDPSATQQLNRVAGLTGVWIVVRDLPKAGAELQALGFKLGRSLDSKQLNATGKEYLADRGRIVLLRPKGPGLVAQFSAENPEGVMGITLRVDDVAASRAIIRQHSGADLPEYQGFYGKSVLIPASIASGAWMELAQSAVP